jgi:hypothetical protein
VAGRCLAAHGGAVIVSREGTERWQRSITAPRSQTYEFCGVATLPVTGFQATLRVTPVIDGDRAFVEWWSTFDCDATRHDELTGPLQRWFGKWLESLRDILGGQTPQFPPKQAATAG